MGYLTVSAPASAEFVEKHSKFIGSVAPVHSEREALDFIASVKKKYWDATHNVYAFVLFQDSINRFSDDGEPQGTAGMPALTVLRQTKIFDAAVVVTRYFGGTLLGAGGLVRAYSNAVRLSLKSAKIAEKRLCSLFEFSCGYPLFEQVKLLVARYEGLVLKTEFMQDVYFEVSVPSENSEAFLASLQEKTSGKTCANFKKEFYL